MDRRGFLGAMLALGAAPAIVRADSLMRIVAPQALILWGDGIHDDTIAMQHWMNGGKVQRLDRSIVGPVLDAGIFRIANTIVIGDNRRSLINSAVKFEPARHDLPFFRLPPTAQQEFSLNYCHFQNGRAFELT